MSEEFQRQHYFYVTTSKHIFEHPTYGIVWVEDSMRLDDAQKYDLRPLILYGLSLPGLSMRWLTYSLLNSPRNLSDVLNEAWRNAAGLQGRPDSLKISKALHANSDGLEEALADIGIKLEVADTKDKSLSSAMRTAQQFRIWNFHRDKKLSDVNDLNQHVAERHKLETVLFNSGARHAKHFEELQKWQEVSPRDNSLTIDRPVYLTEGKWLYGWEASLPPEPSKRYFHKDGNDVASLWDFPQKHTKSDYGLIPGAKAILVHSDADDENGLDEFNPGNDIDNRGSIIKCLLENWPNPASEIAKTAALTMKEIKWLIAGKKKFDWTHLTLTDMLGIAYDEKILGYRLSKPCLLSAKHENTLAELYTNVTYGDANPFEIVPAQGPADPSWRYFIMNGFNNLVVVMSPRGDYLSTRMPDILFNFTGIQMVEPRFYNDLVATCGRASLNPKANIKEIEAFSHIWADKIHEFQWRHI